MSHSTGFAFPTLLSLPTKTCFRVRAATVASCGQHSPRTDGAGKQLLTASVTVLLSSLLATSAVTLHAQPVNAVISEDICIGGEGPGCNAKADGNPYIRELQERSKKNKEKNTQETLERYWTEGYRSYFSFGFNKQLKKDPETGKWSLFTPDDVFTKAIRKAGLLPDIQQ